jgi:pyrroloquinoline-quinone synthase
MTTPARAPLPAKVFIERLRHEGLQRYHHEHPFHRLMHEGRLTPHQLQQWVLNRYYYQTRIPIKDALILAKSEDPAFRRAWIRRIHDHDGAGIDDGGLAQWQRLAAAVGIDAKLLTSFRAVLPGVRFACDGYVSFVREASLLEAVASSLTELFAPDLMAKRIAAWERHYPWVDRQALEYFRARVPRATRDAAEALAFVVGHATTWEQQAQCLAALTRKTEILRHLLDCLYARYVAPERSDDVDRIEPSAAGWEGAAAR